MKYKYKASLIYVGMVIFIIAIIGIAYAFFTADVTTLDEDSSVVISTGTLALTYNGNISTVGTIEKPGDYYTSLFTINNTGGATISSYDILFTEVVNNVLLDEYVYELDCVSYANYGTGSQAVSGTCSGKAETPVPTTDSVGHTGSSINVDLTHEYTLTVTFKDTESAQDYNQGQDVSFKLIIE